MRVLAHPDPWVLEAELLDRVAEAKRGDPFAPVLIVVPTRRLAEHVERRLTERFGSVAAVDVSIHREIARRASEAASGRWCGIASPSILSALILRIAHEFPGNHIAEFLRSRPGAAAALLRTLRDLREAEVGAEAPELADPAVPAGLAEIYGAYTRRLLEIEDHGWTDDAGLVARAVPHVPRWAGRYAAIVHHGAYELTGIHLRLVRALDDAVPVLALWPVAPGSVVTRYAETFASAYLTRGAELEFVPREAASCLGDRPSRMWDETFRGAPLAGVPITIHDAQGPDAEAEVAARLALAGVRARPSSVAIVARSLETYAPAFQEIAALERGVWDVRLSGPLARHPEVRDLVVALRVVADDFPRAATCDALRSPRIRWEALLGGEPLAGAERAEVWSRRTGLVAGLEGWTRDLPARAGQAWVPDGANDDERAEAAARAVERERDAARFGEALRALRDRVEPDRARSWSDHASRIRALRDLLFAPIGGEPEETWRRATDEALAEMARLETVVGDARLVPFAEALDSLGRTVATTEIAETEEVPGGIAVVDALQSRGMTFDRVLVLGLHQGSFPRPAKEDPFLPDAARRALRGAAGGPLHLRDDRNDEERLVLALAVGSARTGLDLFLQRADATGRSLAPSVAWREIARAILGIPDAELLRRSSEPHPTHPERSLAALARTTGLIRPDERLIRVALAAPGSERGAAALASGDPRLAAGAAMLLATESFAPRSPAYDARTGRPFAPKRDWSPSSLERLGRCALRWFFRDGLGIRPLDEEVSLLDAGAAAVGDRVHAVLRDLHETLLAEQLYGAARLEAARARARQLVASLWESSSGPREALLSARLPLLHAREERTWRDTLARAVDIDLTRLAKGSATPESFETSRAAAIDFGSGPVRIAGRLDRVVRVGDGVEIGDYKTSGDLEERTKPTAMLKGLRLQVPLYSLLANDAAVELIGVGPEHLGEPGDAEGAPVRFAGFDGWREAFRETMRVLLALADGGVFPLRTGDCAWCEFRAACRRTHPPTLERQARWKDGEAYALLDGKSMRDAPTLDDVRRRSGARATEADA